MKIKLITLAALALAISPNLVFAQRTPGVAAHTHSITVHDRSPRLHDRTPMAHH